jgi:hypothetical protein
LFNQSKSTKKHRVRERAVHESSRVCLCSYEYYETTRLNQPRSHEEGAALGSAAGGGASLDVIGAPGVLQGWR